MARKRNSVVFGFANETALTKQVAATLQTDAEIVREFIYPSGERALRPVNGARHAIVVSNVTEDPASLFRTLLLAFALRISGARHVDLLAPWIAYGRQDRLTHDSTEAGLGVAFHLSHAFDRIVTFDAHSPAFEAAFRRRLISLLPDYGHAFSNRRFDLVVAPDEGARARAEHAARTLNCPFLILQKRRTPRGVVTAFAAKSDPRQADGTHVLIVDDMADSGGTLKKAAELLGANGVTSARAVVTHAFDLSTLRRNLRPNCADVRAIFDHTSGRIDPCHLDLAAKLLR